MLMNTLEHTIFFIYLFIYFKLHTHPEGFEHTNSPSTLPLQGKRCHLSSAHWHAYMNF